ncbi:MAG TPA: NAD(P)/FAD-dependent oxidoreductase [Anaerolineales bacterium]|nr:NAD(P)/FAD-dependent oxidoreductase [Anaerolineales bacterium]
MLLHKGDRIAVIGAGISGIAAANVLKKNGFEPIVFEKSDTIGGVWAVAYPDIHLQNTYPSYHLSDFPWPFKPDLHPSGSQILKYWNDAVKHHQLDVRLRHDVCALEEQSDGWLLSYENHTGVHEEFFKYVIIAVGQYTEGKYRPHFPGKEGFEGKIITEREVHSLDVLEGKRVAVVGFGKSALDMSTFAATRAAEVHHIFRTPRWTIPEWILGLHFTHILFSRFGTVMMTSWAHPTKAERFLHSKLKGGINKFWDMIAALFKWQIERLGRNKDQAARDRLKAVIPRHKFLPDLRSAGALAPESYYPLVAEGRIQPHQGEVAGFSRTGIQLKNGVEIPCDLAVLSVGSQTPVFPFLPTQYRQLLECEPDGAQLYRHLFHPRIPRLGFAGFNHGFMHIPEVEIGTLWLCALLRGEIKLPLVEEMERSVEHIRAWKRANIQFEPSRSLATNTRFQQYIDILLKDLGVSPYRKLPNVFAEIFGRYGSADYAKVVEEYMGQSTRGSQQRVPLEVNT